MLLFRHSYSLTVISPTMPCQMVIIAQPTLCQLSPLHANSQLRARTIVSDALDLDRHTLGQLLNSHAAAGRLVRKVLLEDAVHLRKVRHIVEEDVDLDDLLNRCVRLLQDGDNVLAALRRLVCDVALDQRAGLVGGDLARHENLGAGDDGLGLGCVSGVCDRVCRDERVCVEGGGWAGMTAERFSSLVKGSS